MTFMIRNGFRTGSAAAAILPLFFVAQAQAQSSGIFNGAGTTSAFFAKSLAAADFNHDGNMDAVTAGGFASTFQLHLTLPDGTFNLPIPISLNGTGTGNSSDIVNILAKDFDHDSNADVVISGPAFGILLLKGDGLGGFGTPVAISTGGSAPVRVVAADLNQDSNLDLIVTYNPGTAFKILFGDGLGGFGAPVTVPVSVTNSLTSIGAVPADYDQDGDVDLYIGGGNFNILLNDGTGAFTLINAPSPNSGGNSPIAGDWNQDGIADLAFGSSGNTLKIALNDGTGHFTVTNYAANMSKGIAAADLDGDGDQDLVGTGAGVTNYINNGAGVFTKGSFVHAGSLAIACVAADANQDGVADVIGLNNNAELYILLEDGNGGFKNRANFPAYETTLPATLREADVDGDGQPEIIYYSQNFPDIIVYNQTSPLQFTIKSQLQILQNLETFETTDLDGDGRADFACPLLSGIQTGFGNASGSFNIFNPLPASPQVDAVTFGDVNADGLPDLIATALNPAVVDLYTNLGGGLFSLTNSLPGGNMLRVTRVADINNDGNLDLISSGSLANKELIVHIGRPSGLFGAARHIPISADGRDLEIADLNHDGSDDIIAAGTGNISIRYGSNISGLSAEVVIIPNLLFPTGSISNVEIHDLNGDGDPEMIATYPAGAMVYIGRGNVQGTFVSGAFRPFILDEYQTALLFTDINGDSLTDLISPQCILLNH